MMLQVNNFIPAKCLLIYASLLWLVVTMTSGFHLSVMNPSNIVDSLQQQKTTRRNFISQVSIFSSTAAIVAPTFIVPQPAFASGGATAGGAYLLSVGTMG